MVKLLPHQTQKFAKSHKGLVWRYEDPFLVEKCVGRLAYCLTMRSHLEIHSIFNVSLLKPYQEDKDDPSRGKSIITPIFIIITLKREVEEIFTHRVISRRGTHPNYTEYFVQWKGQPNSEESWEHKLKLWNNIDKIEANKADAMRTLPS